VSQPYKKPALIVERGELKRALEHALTAGNGAAAKIASMKRRVSDYCSSYLLEEIDLALRDGRTLQLIFKDLSPSALISTARHIKPEFLYEPLREIECYRSLLAAETLGTAKCYGAVVDARRARYWLFLERVPPALLWQMGDFEDWKQTAAWLARMHACLAKALAECEPEERAHLLIYDANFYRCWMRRARTYVRKGDTSRPRKAAAAIDWLAARYEKAIDRLTALPATMIHGEFYPSNVMVDQTPKKTRICPVDWEMAAVGPGLVDLAALTSGQWTHEQKNAMAMAYHAALPGPARAKPGKRTLLADLDYCRLHQAVQLLGWSPKWTPPPEHTQNWLAEAVRLAESLEL
jgi:phosphotransferase family enzyme